MVDTRKKTAVGESVKQHQYVEAGQIILGVTGSTASETEKVRTVATTITTGSLSVRYTPRPPKTAGPADTAS